MVSKVLFRRNYGKKYRPTNVSALCAVQIMENVDMIVKYNSNKSALTFDCDVDRTVASPNCIFKYNCVLS